MKKLLLIAVMAIAALGAKAINPFLEFQPIIVGDDYTAFNLQAGITGKVHPNISLGAGMGVTQQWNFNQAPLIPIFVRGAVDFSVKGIRPFLSFDVGYEVNTENAKYGAVLVNPMVGLKFGKWYGGIGYLGHCWTAKHAGSTNCFNLKIGYNF